MSVNTLLEYLSENRFTGKVTLCEHARIADFFDSYFHLKELKILLLYGEIRVIENPRSVNFNYKSIV